jgi:hypothetical protein
VTDERWVRVKALFQAAVERPVDGRRFVMTLDKAQAKNPAPAQMIFVQHWFEELKRLVPTK